uniref:Leucine-rich repeat-containing N-terminal plant-type domain-containing protein n=1 Tax=Leersia perrieri TaxID=77586 RepID=A0A0D9V001_9ORYZ
MSKLSNLIVLSVASNRIAGSIRVSIKLLNNLHVLDLSDNELTSHIPAELGELTLNSLNMSYNHLISEVPLLLQRVEYNKSFLGNHLCAKARSDMTLPTFVDDHTELSKHDLSSNGFLPTDITGEVPVAWVSLKELTMFDMSCNNLTGTILASV